MQQVDKSIHGEPSRRRLCLGFAILCILPGLYCFVISLEIQSIGTRRASRMVRNHEGNNGASQKGHDKLNMTGKMSSKNDDRPVGKIPHRAGGWPNPIIVVGLPKTGTTSITRYFQCGGIERVSHWRCKDMEYCGPMIQDNVRAGRAPLYGTGKFDVYGQLDIEVHDRCYFPQIEALEEIHKAHPNTTFIHNSRNVTDWVKSVRGWYDMADRLTKCNITGFPTGVGKTDEELIRFFTSQRQRVRNFVAKHPSHQLVEIEIDSPDAGKVMEEAFGIDRKCWGRANVGKDIVPGWDTNS